MFIFHYIRRTALYGIITLLICLFVLEIKIMDVIQGANVLNSFRDYFYAFLFYSIFVYPIMMIFHLIICKIKEKISRYADPIIETFFISLWADIAAPFRKTYMFILIIMKKHKIKDNSTFHNIMDFLDVLVGFIWTLCLMIFILIGIVQII